MCRHRTNFLIGAVIATAMTGCSQSGIPFSSTPQVRLGASRIHFQTGDPVVIVSPLLDTRDDVVGVLVRVPIAKLTAEDYRDISNNSAAGQSRVLVLSSDRGVQVMADGQEVRLDNDAVTGGPWIFCFNEAEAFPWLLLFCFGKTVTIRAVSGQDTICRFWQ